jgi:hypothetical protein
MKLSDLTLFFANATLAAELSRIAEKLKLENGVTELIAKATLLDIELETLLPLLQAIQLIETISEVSSPAEIERLKGLIQSATRSSWTAKAALPPRLIALLDQVYRIGEWEARISAEQAGEPHPSKFEVRAKKPGNGSRFEIVGYVYRAPSSKSTGDAWQFSNPNKRHLFEINTGLNKTAVDPEQSRFAARAGARFDDNAFARNAAESQGMGNTPTAYRWGGHALEGPFSSVRGHTLQGIRDEVQVIVAQHLWSGRFVEIGGGGSATVYLDTVSKTIYRVGVLSSSGLQTHVGLAKLKIDRPVTVDIYVKSSLYIPNEIGLLQTGQSDGWGVIAMKDGGQQLGRVFPKLSRTDQKPILKDIFLGIAQMHLLGYSFADLTSVNVLVGKKNQVRFIDFEFCQRESPRNLEPWDDFLFLMKDAKVSYGLSERVVRRLYIEAINQIPIPTGRSAQEIFNAKKAALIEKIQAPWEDPDI